MNVQPKLRLLVVEDDAADQRLIRDALKQFGEWVECEIVANGTKALELLESDTIGSDLVLLDMNLPCLNGREVLARIRKTPTIQALPVIMHSTSDSPKDVAECYRLGANSYIVKAPSVAQFHENLTTLVKYWREACRLPITSLTQG